MATISPANLHIASSQDEAIITSPHGNDIALLNQALQDIEDLKFTLGALTTGSIIQTLNPVVPTGFLLANGALVSRVTYERLFQFATDNNLIRDTTAQASYESDPSVFTGLTFGPGDDSTTFQLPDLRGRVLMGADSSHVLGTYVKAGLPNITGAFGACGSAYGRLIGGSIGAFSDNGSRYGPFAGTWTSETDSGGISINASKSSSIYGSSTTVQSSAVCVYNLIRL